MAKYKSKNVEKKKVTRPDGSKFFVLMEREGFPIDEFGYYIDSLIEAGAPFNTVEAKAQDLTRFYDFYYEAINIIHALESSEQSEFSGRDPNQIHTPLSRIIAAFPSYLALGKNAPNDLAARCAKNIDSKPLKYASCSRILSSTREYLEQSASLQYAIKLYSENERTDVDVPENVFGAELLKRRSLNWIEKQRFIRNSYLAGCISGGVKYAKVKMFKVPTAKPSSKKLKAFPLKDVTKFLASFTTARDKAIFALICGGGLRPHEADQLLLSDVDIKNQRVSLTTPEVIDFARDYYGIASKGFAHYEVALIEPFKSFFFDSFSYYIQHERPESTSKYCFLTETKSEIRPYYKVARSSKAESFKQNLKRCGLEHLDLGRHSGRHFYGWYMKNFIPNGQGSYGLPNNKIQWLMRHRDPRSTAIYAVEDHELTKDIIECANKLLEEGSFKIEQLPEIVRTNKAFRLMVGQ
ncbi:tyrosine-type recombinase/integrase [Vibrio diazotrophicus]|nr:tyrosine-type recombinase/integrase [Vibrio diazotrophicus]